ncbi:DUF421 domain-containing protein [Kineococcus arenarius]|uniref:DUF421 domain-containing protein n=1 Tax=unclassified Kineococcus TaxID=2621656 RepID=UPI003D7DD084
MTAHEALLGDWRVAVWAAVKGVALFATALALFRISERRTLAAFAPFDWVAAVAVGAVVGRSATASDTSWLTGAAVLLAIFAVHSAIARLRFLDPVRRLVDPPLRVLVRDGVVDQRNMRRCGLTPTDLEAIMRQQGYPGTSSVHLAIFEAKGAVSVVPTPPPQDSPER